MFVRALLLGAGVAVAVAAAAFAHVIGESSEDHPAYHQEAVPPILRPAAQSAVGRAPSAAELLRLAVALLEPGSLRPPLAPPAGVMMAQTAEAPVLAARIRASFAPFAPEVRTRADDRFFYVESNGMPNHSMMVGITAWQQQVPIPQPYVGVNAWRFPLVPVPTDAPLSAREHFFRGAIAIAADGVPIFNPIKNDGRTDTFLAGELDHFGGHAGRADDYHYHVAPVFLQELLGPSLPIAFALDGYPILGYREPDGTVPTDLDAFNGHTGVDGAYHYHATPTYPYLNGGFHGTVVERDGEVDPQPVARGVREATNPLRGAVVVGFTKLSADAYSLRYQIGPAVYTVNYSVDGNRNARFEFIDPAGRSRVEEYAAVRGRR